MVTCPVELTLDSCKLFKNEHKKPESDNIPMSDSVTQSNLFSKDSETYSNNNTTEKRYQEILWFCPMTMLQLSVRIQMFL